MGKKRKIRYNFETLLLLSPFLIIFLIFGAFPIIFSFFISFTDYSGLSPKFSLVGLTNYIHAFKDSIFLTALKNTFVFVIGTIPFTTVFALLLALIINSRRMSSKLAFSYHQSFQRSSYLPCGCTFTVPMVSLTKCLSSSAVSHYRRVGWLT